MHTRDVLVATQGCNDDGTVGKLLAVLGGWWEETLKQSGGRIKHGSTLAAGLHTDVNLLKVHKVGGDPWDLGVTAPSEVGVTKESSQGMRLVLNSYVREGHQNSRGVRASPNGVLSVGPYL